MPTIHIHTDDGVRADGAFEERLKALLEADNLEFLLSEMRPRVRGLISDAELLTRVAEAGGNNFVTAEGALGMAKEQTARAERLQALLGRLGGDDHAEG